MARDQTIHKLGPKFGADIAVPLYEQVKQYIVEGIRSGEWGSGSRLPSENFLVERLGVSRMTVHRALRELKADGVIVRVPGLGTFVSEEKPRTTLLETQDIAREIRDRGSRYDCRIVALDQLAADKDVAAALVLRPGDAVFHSVIVHEQNGTPVQFEERWVLPAVAPGYLEQDYRRFTTHEYLVRCTPISEVEHILHAIRPDRRLQQLLAIPADEPCLLLLRRTWSGSRVVTRSLFVYPGQRYSLGGRYRLDGAPEALTLRSIRPEPEASPDAPARAKPARAGGRAP